MIKTLLVVCLYKSKFIRFSFHFKVGKRRLTKLPKSTDHEATDAAITHRWLPKPLPRLTEIDLACFHGEKPSLRMIPKYEKFSTVCHLTSCKKAKRIIEDGGLAHEKRSFHSVLADKSCEVKGVSFVANTERNVEEFMVTSNDGESLQVKWLIGLDGDSGKFIIAFVVVLSSGNSTKLRDTSSFSGTQSLIWVQCVARGLKP